MKKYCVVVVISLLFLASVLNVSAYDLNSNHISVEHDIEATIEKGYPVILVTNQIDKDLVVTYDFYLGDEVDGQVVNKVVVPARQTVELHIEELAPISAMAETRRIWFSWNEPGAMKPLNTQIDTIPLSHGVEELG